MTINEEIFLLANGYHTPFLDMLMASYTSAWIWAPFYAACLTALIYKYGWGKSLFMLLFIGMAVGASDYICASIIRPMVHSMRPSNPENPFSVYVTIVNGHRGGAYGMPSCHAANCFALAAAIITFTRNRWFIAVLPVWALFICYTRLYVGVHYPSDLLVGGAIGAVIGVAFALAGLKIARNIRLYRESRGYHTMSMPIQLPISNTNIVIPIPPIVIPLFVLLATLLYGLIFAML